MSKIQTRFYDLVNVPLVQNTSISLVGCGAVGSFAAIALAKMGFRKWELWDMDIVEEVNVGVQLYDLSHVGKLKTHALSEIIEKNGEGMEIITVEKFEEDDRLEADIVICAVDTMAARALVLAGTPEGAWFIDTRMDAFDGRCFAFVNTLTNRTKYLTTIVPDNEIPNSKCTEKSTVFCAYMAAFHVIKSIFDRIRNTAGNYNVTVWAQGSTLTLGSRPEL